MGTHGLGQLQGKNRHTTGSLNQYTFAGLEIAFVNQCAPGRQTGTGQCCRLDQAPVTGHPGHRCLGQGNIFGGVTILVVANETHQGLIRATFDPARKTGAHDLVSDLPSGDVGPGLNDLTAGVSQQDSSVFGRDLSQSHHQVVVIEAAGHHLDEDLVCLDPGRLYVDQLKVVEPAGLGQLHLSHDDAFFTIQISVRIRTEVSPVGWARTTKE